MCSMVSIIDWLTLPLFFKSALDVNRCSFLTLTISPAAAFPNAGIQLKGGKSFPSSILNAVASDFSKLTGRIHPGAVVLLHNTSKTNGEILDELLTKWEEMGYHFASLDDLIKATAS